MIVLKLRTDNTKGFRPYHDLINTLIHEMTHNGWATDSSANGEHFSGFGGGEEGGEEGAASGYGRVLGSKDPPGEAEQAGAAERRARAARSAQERALEQER